MTRHQTPVDGPLTVTAVLTVHDRLAKTLSCLRTLFAQTLESGDILKVVLVDDGSTDGTSDRVRADYPTVTIIEGTGDLFWSGGMALAQSVAAESSPDVIMWINDDVDLKPGVVRQGLELLRETAGASIIVGATESRTTGEVTYSGARLLSRRPGHQSVVSPADTPRRLDTFNGNFVLLPRSVYRRLGGVDPGFHHAYGDTDYGLRARALGIDIWLMPGTVGFCEANPVEAHWRHPGNSRRTRLRLLFSRKGYPFRSHIRFNRRNAPVLWPLYVTASYGRAITLILVGH